MTVVIHPVEKAEIHASSDHGQFFILFQSAEEYSEIAPCGRFPEGLRRE